jgi:hypothetical protein
MRRKFPLDVAFIVILLSAVSLLLLTTLPVSAQEHPIQIWNTTWGDTGYDFGSGVAVGSDLYVVGTIDYFGARAGDAVLVKYDTWGTQLWNVTWGGPDEDVGSGVAVGSDIYVVGTTASFGAGSGDAFLAKYDVGGTQLWNTTWGGGGDDWGYGVAVSGDAVYVTGETASFGVGSSDAVLVKYDASGNQLWNVTWGGPEGDVGYGVAVGSDLYVVGTTSSFGVGFMDAFVVRYGFMPVGGVVLPISPAEILLYVAIALSLGALLVVAKMRRRIPRFFSSP